MSSDASSAPPEIVHRGVDPSFPLVREVPAVGLLCPTGNGPARPDASAEPPLDMAEIQGNILAGFNKDFQTLVFLRIDEAERFRGWLNQLLPLIATADEVIAFNRLFKRVSDRRGYRGSVKASWINVAFSHAGLAKLVGADADRFADESFRTGLVGQSAHLGDPTAADAEGHPSRWLVRDGEGEAEVMLIVAADTLADLEAEVANVERLIFSPKGGEGSGAAIVFKEEGRTQLGALAGHEHFGFLDGVSQPGIRGRISTNPHDVLTPRQNPDDPDQGKPGQDLLWPGEFVFGYHGQDPESDTAAGVDSMKDDHDNPVAPEWARNGAYLVFRRLRQDVFRFHQFLNETSGPLELTPEALGARLVGRWRSGAAIMRAAERDIPELGDDDCANNHFEFGEATKPIQQAGLNQCVDRNPDFPQSPGDPTGAICPLAGHIRKTYPRDDTSVDQGDAIRRRLGEDDTQTHRLLRRGIPFGPSSRSTPEAPVDDHVDRGLLFMAYMTSIVDQFEFVTKNWVNKADFKEPNAGVDPILGQTQGSNGSRERTFRVGVNGKEHDLRAPDDWVIPTGGGYFFAPSIAAIKKVLALKVPADAGWGG